jgi:hypothetical protein|tara:strand:- start:131 stop:454 length:324 start_codon:yes stop_codon:yes gene_type:complete
MAIDFGTLSVASAGTPELFADDLNANSNVRARSVVKAIIFKAHPDNTGDVYIGRLLRDNSTSVVSSTYGFTLEPGDAQPIAEPGETFNVFEADVEVSGESVEWTVIF